MERFAESDLFLIRTFTVSDINDFCLLTMDAQCMKYCPSGKLTRRQSESFFTLILKDNEKERGLFLAIEDKSSHRVIGFVGLQECCAEDDIGLSFVFRILPDFFDAANFPPLFNQLIENIFSIFNLDSLQAIVAKNNRSSIEVIESLPFKRVKKIDCRGIASFLYQYC